MHNLQGAIMRPLFLLLPATLLLAPCAFAQDLPYPQSDSPAPPTVKVNAPFKTVWLSDEHARELAGHYEMSNGWDLKVRTAARFIDATIDRREPMRLFHVEQDRFVSSDGSVAMRFNQGDNGDEMTMRYVPDPRLAQVVEISARMAQR
jgi:hypothetical protein